MKDDDCVRFLQWVLPQLQMRWAGFRKVRRQVCKRIRHRMIQLQLADYSAYQTWIGLHPDELKWVDRFCRITISRFYRDRGVFDHLRDHVLPGLARRANAAGRKEVLCWIAGCASGEEPYTVNMIWQQVVAPEMPAVRLKIVATDSDQRMLQRAKLGRYQASSLKDFPKQWVTSCFEATGDEYSVRPEYRSGVEWRQQDIRCDMPHGSFDLIFCRHLVLTYFDEQLQVKILTRIVERLRQDGILVVGKQESLPSGFRQLVELHPRTGMYRSGASIDKCHAETIHPPVRSNGRVEL